MLRAVPSTIFIACSTSYAFKSGNLVSATSLSWSLVIVATVSPLEAPDLTLATFFNKKVELLLDLFGQETSVEASLSEIEILK